MVIVMITEGVFVHIVTVVSEEKKMFLGFGYHTVMLLKQKNHNFVNLKYYYLFENFGNHNQKKKFVVVVISLKLVVKMAVIALNLLMMKCLSLFDLFVDKVKNLCLRVASVIEAMSFECREKHQKAVVSQKAVFGLNLKVK